MPQIPSQSIETAKSSTLSLASDLRGQHSRWSHSPCCVAFSIASREANLQQRDKSWVSTAKLLAGCRMDEAWDSFQVEDVGRKVDDFLADLGAQKVYAD
eukprot:symbB.v1.2.014428.t3/scaffold1000.1/size145704/19